MKTLSVVAFAIGLASGSAATRAQDLSATEIKTTHVAGSVYMLEGAGGNIGASIGDDGIVIVDDQYVPLAQKIRTALKAIADKPVRFVINTHYHDDHTNGNLEWYKQATIIAHDNLRTRLANREATPETAGKVTGATPNAWPLITYDHELTVHMNGEDVRAMFVPHAHTDGDSLVYFTKSNVLHTGDNFVRYGFPYVDLDAGGSINGMIAALESTLSRLPADVKIIPGHGQLSNVDDVRKFVAMLRDSRAAVERGVHAGKSADQLKREKVLEPWKEWDNSFVTTDIFTDMLYRDVTASNSASSKQRK
jgi:glyoxylase-like metal-dependent hydrolase (beta-lactamase superfamily II)